LDFSRWRVCWIAGSGNVIGVILVENIELGQPIAKADANEHNNGSILGFLRNSLIRTKGTKKSIARRYKMLVPRLTMPAGSSASSASTDAMIPDCF
jgi:hypothetical protein